MDLGYYGFGWALVFCSRLWVEPSELVRFAGDFRSGGQGWLGGLQRLDVLWILPNLLVFC